MSRGHLPALRPNIGFAVIPLAIVVGCTRPGAPDTPDSAADTGAVSDCGARVTDYAYARAFADTAAWNTPICDLEPWVHSDAYVERFWFYSNNREADPTATDVDWGRHAINFGLGLPVNDFAVPTYRIADATTTRSVRQRTGWPGGTNLQPADTVPWNPSWRASGGSDASLIILDPDTGREWDLWGVVQADSNGVYNDSQCWFDPDGYDASTHLCVGSAHLVESPDGAVADYRTYGGNHPSRGVQIQHYAMVTEPEEVAAGEVRHALMMGASNTMFGPVCSADAVETDAGGSTCGFALSPAGGVEWASGPWTTSALSDTEQRERSIPEGIRYGLTLSDDDIETWLDDRGYTGRLRETARIFAVALTDYGWFITDTGGTAPFSVSGAANVQTAEKWRALGISDDGMDLLHGLITRDRIWAVEPATNDCADGTTTHFGCPSASVHY
jgi:hypothetical protein